MDIHNAVTIYLSGEIHTDWRTEIQEGITQHKLNVYVTSPVTDHHSSDHCGVDILGKEDVPYWKDHKGAQINRIRNQTMIGRSDIVIVRFGEQYRQWNAAFDAGYAIALSKPLITLHDETLDHALKEIDSASYGTTRCTEQVIDILRYVTQSPTS